MTAYFQRLSQVFTIIPAQPPVDAHGSASRHNTIQINIS